jgi:drug/metabolite transporter (DMT)-like permease
MAVTVALVTVYILWGSTYLGIRFAEESIPALLMGCLRFLVAGGLMIGWGLLRRPRGEPLPTIAQWRSTAIVGVALLGCGNGGVIWAEQHVPSGIAAIVVATVPLHMAWLDRVFFRQAASRWTMLGIGAGFAGLVVLVQPSGGNHIDIAGVLVMVVGSFCWAAGSLYARTAPMPRTMAMSSGMEMLAGGVVLGLAGVIAGEVGRVHPAAISGKSLAAVAYLVVFGSIVGFSAYAWLIRNARTSLVSTYAYVNPVVAVLLGALFAAEAITLRTVIAGAIILSGVALIVARPAAPRGLSAAAAASAEPGTPVPETVGASVGSREEAAV